MNVLKEIWGYEFNRNTQDCFARELENFYINHPEYGSYKEIAEMVGIDPAWLSKLRNRNDRGEYGMKLRFHHLINFCLKGVVDVHKLQLGRTKEEEWILLLCDTFKDDDSFELLKQAAEKQINVSDLIRKALSETE